MPLRGAEPLIWHPRGCSDASDGSVAFKGAMKSLINLVPAPATMDQWAPRPARDYLTNFVAAGFSASPSTIQGIDVFGDVIFGLITTLRNPGRDEPFAVNAITGQIIPVSGVTALLCPTTPPAGPGATQLPIPAIVGPYDVWTHPGFAGGIYNPDNLSTTITANAATGSPVLTGNFSGQIFPGMQLTDTAGAFPPGTVALGTGVVDINTFATGSSGANFFTVANATNVAVGQFVNIQSIPLAGIVTSVSGTTIGFNGTLPVNISGAPVNFHGTTVTVSMNATATAVGDTVQFATGPRGVSGTTSPGLPCRFGWFDLSGAEIALTATTTLGSPELDVESVAGLSIGMMVSGTGIPSGARIINIQNPNLSSVPGNAIAGQTDLTVTITYPAGTMNGSPPRPPIGSIATGPGIPNATTVVGSNWLSIANTSAILHIILSAAVSGTAGQTISGLYSVGGLLIAVMDQNATAAGTATLTVTGGTIDAPLWCAGDTVINGLPSTPVGVGSFSGRAYFACGLDGSPYSDIQNPSSRTYASQAIIPGNGLPVTACAGQPLMSPVTGGMTSAIYLFQRDQAIQQVSGDQQFGNLQVQALNIATGTRSPAAISPTTAGMAFVSPEGLRIIEFTGTISEPIGEGGKGITIPFINAFDPTRIVAAANGQVIRVALQNAQQIGQPWVEWWYSLPRKAWCGPHTLQTSAIVEYGESFITAAQDVPAQLYKSPSLISGLIDYEEDGRTLTWTSETVLLPDTEAMMNNMVVESTLALQLPSDQPVTVQAFDEGGLQLDSVVVPGAYTMPLYGGPNLWGTGQWYSAPGFFRQEVLPWHTALNFKQASFRCSGVSRFGTTLGTLRLRYQRAYYIQQQWPVRSVDTSVLPLPNAPVISGQPQALVITGSAPGGTVIGAVLTQAIHYALAVPGASFVFEYNQGNSLALTYYSSTTITGTTHNTTTIDSLSANVLSAGWLPGHYITDNRGAIPPGTYITAIAAGGLSVGISQAAVRSLAGVTFAVSGGNLTTAWASPIPPGKIIAELQIAAPGFLTSYWAFIVTVTT